MNYISKIINFIINIERWIAILVLTFMMFFTMFAVISRALSSPIVGDYELTELCMVVLIMTSLAFTEKKNEHISIDILVNRFSHSLQIFFDIGAQILTFIFSSLISIMYLIKLFESGDSQSSELLKIPFLPFKVIIIIGFLMWALAALLKIVNNIRKKRKEDDIWHVG